MLCIVIVIFVVVVFWLFDVSICRMYDDVVFVFNVWLRMISLLDGFKLNVGFGVWKLYVNWFRLLLVVVIIVIVMLGCDVLLRVL